MATTLTQLTEKIREFERSISPGSETGLWAGYCEAMRRDYGALPIGDFEDAEVSDEDAEWWLSIYRLLEAYESRISELRETTDEPREFPSFDEVAYELGGIELALDGDARGVVAHLVD